jgi:hypothetical protein
MISRRTAEIFICESAALFKGYIKAISYRLMISRRTAEFFICEPVITKRFLSADQRHYLKVISKPSAIA